jgi:hypothetical protein
MATRSVLHILHAGGAARNCSAFIMARPVANLNARAAISASPPDADTAAARGYY